MAAKILGTPVLLIAAAAISVLSGCATTISGRVVRPDGSALANAGVKVYTSPRTSTARVEKDGSYKLSGNVTPDNEYTLVAEDREGNAGYVRGYKPRKGSNKDVVIRMSREMEAKDAVLEGGGPSETGSGSGEKILKSSQ